MKTKMNYEFDLVEKDMLSCFEFAESVHPQLYSIDHDSSPVVSTLEEKNLDTIVGKLGEIYVGKFFYSSRCDISGQKIN